MPARPRRTAVISSTCSPLPIVQPNWSSGPERPGWQLSRRQLCDLELLASGGFSPLELHGRGRLPGCSDSMRLADGTLWPIPVTLDVPEEIAAAAGSVGMLALRDSNRVILAMLHVTEAWQPDLHAEALQCTARPTPVIQAWLTCSGVPTGDTSSVCLKSCSCQGTGTSCPCGTRRGNYVPNSRGGTGVGSLRSRRATRCTAPTSS